MPEIGEVARVVHYIRKHLVGRTIKTCEGFADDIVYGKVGCSADQFQKHVTGRKVLAADQQGKYFYMLFDKPPHAVMHFGMTGWMKFDREDSHYYKRAQTKDGKEAEEWPPKYMKYLLKCEAETVQGEEKGPVEAAFVDARRLARIRLVDCDAHNIRNESPLKENGPDPVRDKHIVTVDWLKDLLGRKKVPVKALLLDQASLSGVGNWVADEVLYQARIHPEQYSNTFGDAQIKQLHDALSHVCTTACETLAESSKFPETWLMKYRWDKGKKDGNILPNGEKIVHLKVGGRTSAIVPSKQKKTGAVAADVDGAEDEGEEKPRKGRKRKSKAAEENEEEHQFRDQPAAKKGRGAEKGKAGEDDDLNAKPAAKKAGRGKKTAMANGTDEGEGDEVQADDGEEVEHEVAAEPEKPKKAAKGKKATLKEAKAEKPVTPGKRRSARTKAK